MSPDGPLANPLLRPFVAPDAWPDAHDCIVFPSGPPTGREAADPPAPDGPSEAAPEVRVFVGTDDASQRAERVLLWSIARHRDPSRAVAVTFLRELSGFDRRGWATRFEGYGFAVPQLCAGRGRALYLAVDQAVSGDVAELFDADLGERAWLAAPGDASALLIDCARCAPAWTLDRVRARPRRRWAERAPRGPLPEGWAPCGAQRLRFAALHTQPWRPYPHRYVYRDDPRAERWLALEREALDAGFEVFARDRPSARFASRRAADPAADASPPTLARMLDPRSGERALGSETAAHDVAIRDALRRCGAKTLRIHTLGRGEAWRRYCERPPGNEPRLEARWGADGVEICDLLGPGRSGPPGRADLAVCSALERVPVEDVPWLLGEIFDGAERFVHLGLRDDPEPRALRTRAAAPLRRTARWWIGQIEHAARRRPELGWQVVFARGARTRIHRGGRHPGGGPPAVWVLTDDRPGNTSQSIGLAQALGWPYAVKHLHFSQAARLQNRLLGPSSIGVSKRRSSRLAPPWPDLVIAAGRRSAPVAQWIRSRNGGRTRVVHLGRKGGDAADRFDLVVTPSYGKLDPHPRRLVTSAPLHSVREPDLERAAQDWSERLAAAPRPRIAVLVGGWSGQYRFDPATARRLGRAVRSFADRCGGSILATTSRRSTDASSRAFGAELGPEAIVYRWLPGDAANPYLAFLALADAFVITGDSEAMLAEAATRGRPIYIYDLPVRTSFAWMRLGRDWVYARAHAQRPDPAAGGPGGAQTGDTRTGDTQNGLGYLCARLIDLGFVRPTRDLTDLHQGLIREGAARRFGEPFDAAGCRPPSNEERVVERVCALMGFEALR